MAIAWNTGTTVDDANTAAASQTVTIPAGVNAGDVMLLAVTGWSGANATEVIQASSTGTAPVIIGTTKSLTFSSTNIQGAAFYVVASAADAGKVITVSFVSGATSKWSIALGAWRGVSNASPVDASAAITNSGTGVSLTEPTVTTHFTGDWCAELGAIALAGSAYGGGTGFTQRESHLNASSGGGAFIWDSNGPVTSPAGGAVYTNGGNSWWIGFTIALAPPSASGRAYALPGKTWLRRYHHRQALPRPPVTAVTTTGTAALAAAGAVSAAVTQDAGTATTLAGAGAVVTAGQTPFQAIPGTARPGLFTPGNPGSSLLVIPAAPVVPVLASAAAPGRTWLRRFRHRQAVQPPQGAGTVITTATATIAGAGAVTAAVTQAVTGTAAGAGSVTAAVTEIAPATAAGAGAVNGLVTLPGGGTITGSGSVGTAVTQGVIASLAGAGSVTDVVTLICIAALTGAGAVNASGSVPGGPATATLAGAGAVSAVSAQAVTAAAAGAAQVTTAVTQAAKATAAGAGTVSASGAITGTASLNGAGHVTVAAAQAATGSAAAAGALSALATQAATAALAGAGTVNAAAVARQAVTAAQGTATVTAVDTSTASVTDPRDGTDSVTAAATGTSSVS